MPWTKLDDHFWANPKIQALPSDTARWLYVAALNYSTAMLTDGRITRDNVRILLGNHHGNAANSAVTHLVKGGLFDPDPDEKQVWWIHDYDQYQPTKAQVEQGRIDARDRKRKQREKARSHVTGEGLSRVTKEGVTLPRPDPTLSIPLSSLTHTLTDILNGPQDDDGADFDATDEGPRSEPADWAFPPEGAIIDLWRQAVTTTLHHQDTSTIRDPHAYTAAIYRNLLTEHHANLENSELADAVADCPECDTDGLRHTTTTGVLTSRDDPAAAHAHRCSHIRAVKDATP